MITVFIPIVILFLIVLVPSIPKIGGNVRIALLLAALSAAVLGGLGPLKLISAAISGIDRLAWVIMLSIFGSIYAETQSRLGTVDATLNSLRSLFGKSPMGLITAIMLTLVLAGSLLGDAIAAATVIGFLVIHSLHELKLKPEQIGMIILLGASLGSLMPPISQSIYLSASLIDIDPEPAVRIAYFTVGLGVLLAILECYRFVRQKKLPEDLIPKENAWSIIKSNRYTFIPLLILAAIVIANSGFGYNIYSEWGFFAFPLSFISDVPVVKGLVFPVVLSIIIATGVSFCFKAVRKGGAQVFTQGLRNVSQTVQIQICAGIMIGVFYDAGIIDTVQAFTENLDAVALKVGGALGLIIIGMLTGSQSTAQLVIFTFLGPVLLSLQVDSTYAILGASHIASAAQNLPPVGLTAFVICGLIAGMIHQKVDPVKVMILAIPNSLYFIIIGFIFWLL